MGAFPQSNQGQLFPNPPSTFTKNAMMNNRSGAPLNWQIQKFGTSDIC
jgi:hypothetical protein